MENSLAYRLLLVLTGCLSAGCAGHIYQPGALADYRVTSRVQNSSGDFCRDFSLTPAQARWFFGRAKALAATQEDGSVGQLTCRVRGTAVGMNGVWQWEIRANGSALLIAPDGAIKLLSCNTCRAVLP